MPSVRYYNQTAPFWDFVANLEDQGANHPFFGGGNHNNASEDEHDNPSDQEQHRGPSWGSWPFGPMPHRGRHGHPRHHHHGPPPPPPPPGPGDHHPEHPAPPPEYNDEDPPISQPEDGEPGPSHPPHSHGPRGPWGSRHGGHGGRGRGWGGRGRNHCGARGHGGSGVPPFFAGGFPFAANLSPLADLFQSQAHLWGGNNSNGKAEAGNGTGNSFKPEVDVFDTTEAFIVHMSLPGAKKEDVGVDWDAEKSELRVAGVVYRPGDEELIKTLALDERTVGEFERKVRLGSRANPAQVDVEGISAKLEDGILRIEVPKMESGFVEVRKVDIE